MVHIQRSVTIRRPRHEVYEFWRDLGRLPTFMQHLASVTEEDGRSHWVARAPAGLKVEWDAEITHEQPDELIEWESIEGTGIPNGGSVRFVDAPADRGTEVHVDLHYEPPGGRVAAAAAKLFGEEPSQQLRDDMRRLKQVMETGEVVLSDGSPEGAGQGARKQRASQPLDGEEDA